MIRRRHLCSDRENISLHYFHSFAAENRVNFSEFSDIRPDNSGITYRIAEHFRGLQVS